MHSQHVCKRLKFQGHLHLWSSLDIVMILKGKLSANLQGKIEKAFKWMSCCAARPAIKE